MADSPKEPRERPARSSREAEIVDAVTQGADRVARLSPDRMLNLVVIIALGTLVFVFAFKSWSEADERKAERRSNDELHNSQMRENNAQMEMTRQHCSQQYEALRRDFEFREEKARKDHSEQVRAVLATFLAEGDKQRAFQAQENEKVRALVTAALKKGLNEP